MRLILHNFKGIIIKSNSLKEINHMISKPDYGIDAPPLIRGLSICGIMFCAASSKGFGSQSHNLTFSYIFLITGLLFITLAILMLYSSKSGKLKQRDKLIDSLNIKGDETILDLGCGKGLLLIAAAKKLTSGKAVGVDIWKDTDLSKNNPDTTTRNAVLENVAERVEVKTADMRDLPFDDESIDIITASMAVHNIKNKEERRKALQEINRVLRPEGKIAIIDFKHTSEYAAAFREMGRSNIAVSGLKFGMFPPVRIVSVN